MPQKKKDGMGLEKPVSEVHADHELFLQAFESESLAPSASPLTEVASLASPPWGSSCVLWEGGGASVGPGDSLSGILTPAPFACVGFLGSEGCLDPGEMLYLIWGTRALLKGLVVRG